MGRYGISYDELMQNIDKDFRWLTMDDSMRECNETREHPFTPEELAKKKAFLDNIPNPAEAEGIVSEDLGDLEQRLVKVDFVDTHFGFPCINLGTEKDTIYVPTMYVLEVKFSQRKASFKETFFIDCEESGNGEGYVWKLREKPNLSQILYELRKGNRKPYNHCDEIKIIGYEELEMQEVVEEAFGHQTLLHRESTACANGVLPDPVRFKFEEKDRKELIFQGVKYVKLDRMTDDGIPEYDAIPLLQRNINELKNNPELQKLLTFLKSLVDKTIEPYELKPHFAADGYFRNAHPIPNTEYFVMITDSELVPEDGRLFLDVLVLTHGPNFGSAGGPTLTPFDTMARLEYQRVK